MARYIFYTQTKTTLLYSEKAMDWIIFASFVWAATALFIYHTNTFVFLPFFGLVLYNIFLYKPTIKDWDMGGFKKMVIDTDKQIITFDDRVKLKISDIERVRIELDERPRMFWLLGLGSQYSNLVNGEVFFKLETKTNTVIPIQFKDQVEKLVEVMHKVGKPCRIQNEEFLQEGVPSYIWYLLFFVLVGGSIAIAIVKFFQNVLSGTM